MNRSKSRTKIFALASILSLSTACSQTSPHLGTTTTVASKDGTTVLVSDSRSILSSGALAGDESILTKVEVKVLTVDLKNRTLTVAPSNGMPQSIAVPANVRNFPQMRPGDLVEVAFEQRVAFELREPTADEIAVSSARLTAVGRARLGDLPGGIAMTAGLAVVTIDSVDKDKQLVNVKTQDGNVITIQAKYPENLTLVKPGQKAVVKYGETVVAGVDRL